VRGICHTSGLRRTSVSGMLSDGKVTPTVVRRRVCLSGGYDEIEGISHHPSGVLYVAVAVNDWEFVNTDDFNLYTFRFRNLPPEAV
jgi:hypothetical protein